MTAAKTVLEYGDQETDPTPMPRSKVSKGSLTRGYFVVSDKDLVNLN